MTERERTDLVSNIVGQGRLGSPSSESSTGRRPPAAGEGELTQGVSL